MLIVPSYVAASPLHGLGVFTREPLRAGQMVSRFVAPFDVEFTPPMLASLTPAEQAYLKIYAYLSRFTHKYILTGDHDRFMNHSDNPNVIMNPDDSPTNLAARDIAAGEELTCDYRTFDAEWRIKLPHLA